MTRLLVSVRSPEEAEEAIEGGAQVIDAKEPTRGPMGRCDDAIINAIISSVKNRVPVSAALGELGVTFLPPPIGVAFAKIGLHGWRDRAEWNKCWLEHRDGLPIQCGAIMVAYADADAADVLSPTVDDIVATACRLKADGILIDTCSKNGATLCDWLDRPRLQDIVDRCRVSNVMIALAGSLDMALIEHLRPIRPDIFAVRGAACDGGRNGRISARKVRAIAELVGENQAVLSDGQDKR